MCKKLIKSGMLRKSFPSFRLIALPTIQTVPPAIKTFLIKNRHPSRGALVWLAEALVKPISQGFLTDPKNFARSFQAYSFAIFYSMAGYFRGII
jgi:hypothetical protein